MPMIWFDTDTVSIRLDWRNKAYHSSNPMPFQEISETIEAMKEKERIAYLLSNPNNIPSLYFAERFKEKIDLEDLQQFSREINEDLSNTQYAKRIAQYVEAKNRGTVKKGQVVQDFTLPDANGEQVPVISMSENPKVIALFSSGCIYSIASIGLLEKLRDSNQKGYDIISLWEDPSKEIWLTDRAEEKEKITWTNLWDEYGFAAAYLNRSITPTFYVVNEAGELTHVIKGYKQKTLDKLREIVK